VEKAASAFAASAGLLGTFYQFNVLYAGRIPRWLYRKGTLLEPRLMLPVFLCHFVRLSLLRNLFHVTIFCIYSISLSLSLLLLLTTEVNRMIRTRSVCFPREKAKGKLESVNYPLLGSSLLLPSSTSFNMFLREGNVGRRNQSTSTKVSFYRLYT